MLTEEISDDAENNTAFASASCDNNNTVVCDNFGDAGLTLLLVLSTIIVTTVFMIVLENGLSDRKSRRQLSASHVSLTR